MPPPPTWTSLARPSVAHRRWRTHRLVLALSARLADPGLWVSGTCRVHVVGGVARPGIVVTDADPPVDGVLDADRARLIVQFDDGVAPATWCLAGADVAWRLHRHRAEVTDAAGSRVVAAPCHLPAPVLVRPMPWPLPDDADPRGGPEVRGGRDAAAANGPR